MLREFQVLITLLLILMFCRSLLKDYTEKIWRLPQTYIAVDGFEVAVPTLRRDHLDIPSDAVVYLCTQRGYKQHPDTVRLQMQFLSKCLTATF